MYLYLTMLSDNLGFCHPTIDQIRRDLGLLSDTMVFDALSVLEEYGFIVRTRRAFPDSRSKRNVYQRTACEYTILRLLENDRIDAALCPIGADDVPAAEESRQLAEVGLSQLLGDAYGEYSAADPASKKTVLIRAIGTMLQSRERGIFA